MATLRCIRPFPGLGLWHSPCRRSCEWRVGGGNVSLVRQPTKSTVQHGSDQTSKVMPCLVRTAGHLPVVSSDGCINRTARAPHLLMVWARERQSRHEDDLQ